MGELLCFNSGNSVGNLTYGIAKHVKVCVLCINLHPIQRLCVVGNKLLGLSYNIDDIAIKLLAKLLFQKV